jgi:ABC-type transport system involved in multi-copper enzyme maturation permease subunit
MTSETLVPPSATVRPAARAEHVARINVGRILLEKAWLETRTRFLASALILALLGVSTVFRAEPTIRAWESFHPTEVMPYALYVWLSLSHGYLMFFWLICAVILGLGGLVREHAAGTAGFTLSLPVSRTALVSSRALVGASEALALALIPGTLVALLSPLIGRQYALSQALLFGALMGCGGMVFYGVAFLLSHLLRGEYAAPGVALSVTAAVYVLVKLPELSAFDVFALMTGSEYMVEGTYLLGRTFPVLRLAGCLALSALLVVASTIVARRREF